MAKPIIAANSLITEHPDAYRKCIEPSRRRIGIGQPRKA